MDSQLTGFKPRRWKLPQQTSLSPRVDGVFEVGQQVSISNKYGKSRTGCFTSINHEFDPMFITIEYNQYREHHMFPQELVWNDLVDQSIPPSQPPIQAYATASTRQLGGRQRHQKGKNQDQTCL